MKICYLQIHAAHSLHSFQHYFPYTKGNQTWLAGKSPKYMEVNRDFPSNPQIITGGYTVNIPLFTINHYWQLLATINLGYYSQKLGMPLQRHCRCWSPICSPGCMSDLTICFKPSTLVRPHLKKTIWG
jgi:hypothetical protein